MSLLDWLGKPLKKIFFVKVNLLVIFNLWIGTHLLKGAFSLSLGSFRRFAPPTITHTPKATSCFRGMGSCEHVTQRNSIRNGPGTICRSRKRGKCILVNAHKKHSSCVLTKQRLSLLAAKCL